MGRVGASNQKKNMGFPDWCNAPDGELIEFPCWESLLLQTLHFH